MKKLVSLTSLAFLFVLVVSCSNRNKTPKVIEETDRANGTETIVDTLKGEGQSNVSDSTVGTIGTVKDSTIDHGKPNQIIHGSPDQAKLDSIKKAKQRQRNN